MDAPLAKTDNNDNEIDRTRKDRGSSETPAIKTFNTVSLPIKARTSYEYAATGNGDPEDQQGRRIIN